MDIAERYNQKYFNWYKKIGEYGEFTKSKFSKYIKKSDSV